ncbi:MULTISPECIES: nicotinate-nucleotide adenylyltransferase [Clostridium]|uniref:nicotinate-nucleotide adenylyltransferase n=1 Tax=Clostridium TaxID=1485 RepID=UPI00069FEA24|nr:MULTISPECIES: nicotinate-nucleotide adenylyltransferase [Clostridium]KOF56730.1 nicotinate-nucleotide adenylyltransferase [Clostridium sp. DMHC 10]MCD2347545.1 nicotinate-nucleotide adenylyltransferase [Clostridium guangxiense]
MEKKAILGGTFDPFHNGHMNIAYESLYRLGLDEIIFMPAGSPPHKNDKIITSPEIRYDMIKKSITGEEKFKVSRYEIDKKGYSYTYKTLEYINSIEKNTELYFITGVDCLMYVDEWKCPEQIFKCSKFVVFNRPGYERKDILRKKSEIENKYEHEVIFMDIPLLDISSTQIRKKVKKCEEIKYLVPREVYDIIKNNKLYI